MSKKKDSLKPWLSRPAINRSVTLPLTRPLTQRLSNLNEFHPNELDPYLLFDARDSMIGTLENPTLDLDPSKPDTLNVITATRAGVATYTDSSGLIQSASANTTRVDYTQGAELTPTVYQNIGYTDFSSSLWVKSNATVTLNEETAPDGTQTASKYVGSGTGQDLYYNATFTGPFTYSLFVKYINAPYIRLRNDSVSTWFNLTTGSVATKNHDSASIEDVGDGWFRISVTVSSASSLLRAFIHPHATDNTTAEQDGGSFYLWGPQVEEGTTATDFVANTTGSPKFITGATFGPRVPMILVEPAATNLIENTDFSGWVQASDTTLTDGAGYAGEPSKIFQHSGTTGAKRFASNTFATTAGTTYTGSLWIRRVTGTGDIYINHEGSAQGNHTEITSEISEEWTRIEVNFTGNASSGNVFFAVWIYQGDSVEIAVPQVEAGTVATSFIPTSGGDAAARTRAADDLSIDPDSTNLVTHSDFSGGWQEYLINSSAGSGYSLNSSRVITSTGTNAAYYIPVPTSNGATYTASIWARRVSGSGGCNIIYLSSPTAKQSISLTTEWQKFTATFTGKSGGGDVNFGVDIVTSGDSIEIAMPQVELGSDPTGFILTSGAAASRTTFSDFYNTTDGTFYLEAIDRDPTSGTHSFLRGQTEHRDFLFKYNGTSIHSFDGSTGVSQSGISANQLFRAAISYEAGSRTLSLNGTSPPDVSLSTGWTTADRLRIGNGNTVVANMHVKRVIYWPYHKDNL